MICCEKETETRTQEKVYTPLMTTSGHDFSFISETVLAEEALSVGSSMVLTLVLGRLLLCGLFCPFVNIGVGALELISIGMV